MKTIRPMEVTICDKCGTASGVHYKCMRCGKDYCFSCKEKDLVLYPHGVHTGGAGDGEFCHACDEAISTIGISDPMYALQVVYRRIQHLEKRERIFYEGFKINCELAERIVERLYQEYKNKALKT